MDSPPRAALRLLLLHQLFLRGLRFGKLAWHRPLDGYGDKALPELHLGDLHRVVAHLGERLIVHLDHERRAHRYLQGARADDSCLFVLIGYMRFLTKWFVARFPGRIVNVHPSLLPEFAGERDPGIYESILASGKARTGA